MTKIKLAQLVFDLTIYPRMNVDNKHVNDIAQAISSGTDLPPIICEKGTWRIVDGFHRGKANLKLFEPDHEIEVVAKTYKSRKDLIADVGRYNTSHGLKMDRYDQTHYILLAREAGLDDKTIAGILHVNPDFVGELVTDRTAFAGPLKTQENSGPLTVPIKQSIRHKAGQTLTKEQQEVNTKLSGMNQVFHVNQLIMLIESELIDMDNAKLGERLRVLHGLLDELLVAK